MSNDTAKILQDNLNKDFKDAKEFLESGGDGTKGRREGNGYYEAYRQKLVNELREAGVGLGVDDAQNPAKLKQALDGLDPGKKSALNGRMQAWHEENAKKALDEFKKVHAPDEGAIMGALGKLAEGELMGALFALGTAFKGLKDKVMSWFGGPSPEEAARKRETDAIQKVLPGIVVSNMLESRNPAPGTGGPGGATNPEIPLTWLQSNTANPQHNKVSHLKDGKTFSDIEAFSYDNNSQKWQVKYKADTEVQQLDGGTVMLVDGKDKKRAVQINTTWAEYNKNGAKQQMNLAEARRNVQIMQNVETDSKSNGQYIEVSGKSTSVDVGARATDIATALEGAKQAPSGTVGVVQLYNNVVSHDHRTAPAR